MPLAELIFVLFALLALATPFITLVLLGKYKKLRENLDQLREENSRQHVSFQREVADLQRQLLAAVHPAAPAVGQPTQPPAAPATSAKKETPVPAAHVDLPAPLTLPAPVLFPMPEKKPEAQPLPKPQEPAPIAPAPVPIAPASTPAQKLPAPPAPVEPKPVLPAVAKTSAEVKPAARVAPQGTPPSLTSPQPPAPRIPAPTPRAPAGIPPATAARVSAPPPVSAYRAPAPRPTFQQRMKTVSAIEEALGTNWLPKIGIIMTVIGFALLGIYELGALGAPGKVGISYFASAVLLGGGIFLEKNERYRLLGRTSIGGGWALLFFSTFGIYHVQAMRVLPVSVGSLTLDCVLMLIVAVAMALHTLRYRSQFVTGLAFLLGYTTVALSQDTVYSLSAGVFLAIGLVSIVLKMGWFELEVFGILSSYLNHLYWLYRLLGIEGAHGRHFEEYRASLALLFFYWLTFRISYIARNIKTDFEEHISTLAALLNVLLLLGVMKFQSVQPELAYLALLVVGALEFSLAQLPITKRRRQAFVVLSVVGATLMLAAVPFHYSGNNVAILWLVGAEAFLAAGIIAKEVVFRHLGLLTGLLVGLHLLGLDFRHLLNLRLANEDPALAAGVLFSLCAVVFYINSLGVGSRWKDLFDGSSGRPLLTIHSYLGAFAAASAAWALFSHDWTALAFGAIMLILAALGRVLESPNLQVQYALLGLLTFCRAMVVNLHLESPEHAHVRLRLLTFPILGAAFYLTARLAALRDEPGQRTIRGLFAAAGSGCFVLLIWFEAPELWQPLACMVFAVALSEAARALRYHALAWHAHLLTGLAVFTALTADPGAIRLWHTIPVRSFSALPVVVGGYWLAKRLGTSDERHLKLARVAYTWAGTGIMVWVLQEALRAPWIAVGWIVFAVVLALSTRWIRYQQLAWQANVVGLCALVRAFFYNYELEQKFWGPMSLRIFTISLVAAGLYFLSQKAAPKERYARAIAFLHSFAATGLLALLAWYEAPNGWLAPLWAAFALVLAIVDQRFELDELPWQSHALAGLTLLRSISVNLYVTATWHGISVRLLSLAIVAVIFYALARLIRMPDEWRKRDIHHVYSWAASAIGGLLLWYELQSQPTGIAVAWGAFGLVLFEYGLLRKITQFRYQAYVALIASFARIFLANLTAGEPGEFWGPRMYTILPLVLIFFFVYAQLPPKEENTVRDRRLHFDVLLAYLGTATIVALFYFQFPIEWVVSSWAAVVFALLGAALLLDQPLFLHQGLLLTVGVLARGMAHNLFGAGYFGEGDWQGRYFVLSSAAVILLASLFFAFRLRGRYGIPQNVNPWIRPLALIAGRPEQVVFFAPIILITFMLALKMRSGMVTVSWGIEGVVIFVLGLATRQRSFRLTGIGILLLCVAKVFALDVWGLQTRDKYITVIIVGVVVSFVSFLWATYKDAIRQFL
ncbi:MAG: hypothetical protein DMG54_02860 [Acidobacteria bacterium]|nr:MAG: hypothetical protein DMG54_02860 [Acidobacteriota bacterium]PYU74870.1 MAG: hypothetical protein DMG52_09880 [Acidobacteriota bacterium]